MTNSHAQLAQERIAGVHEWQSYEGSTDATNIAAAIDALMEATLAVAYEQRTANIIASMNPVEMSDDTSAQIQPDAAARRLDEVFARLYPKDSK